jgi:bifunctional DNase/RNase
LPGIGADNGSTMSILMELSRILIAETRDYQLIELKEVDGERRLPIVIGIFEAAAIERRLKGVQIKRPQTHDLLANTIEAMGGRLDRIVINDLREDTFFAQLVVDQDGRELKIDSRPSDAIALGIANEVRIYVEPDVLDRAATQ